MSGSNNTFPFSDMEAGNSLDISAIFGEDVPGSDVNPFEALTAQGPVEVVTPSKEPDPQSATEPEPAVEPIAEPEPVAEAEPVAEPEPVAEAEPVAEPVAEAEPVQSDAAPVPKEEPAPAPDPQPAPQAPPPSEGTDIISAAFSRQEEKNTQQGLLDRPPVFCHKNVKEPIEDASITFEELRIMKSDDFADLEEGKSVSWTVEYCGIRKEIKDPKGTTILSVKETIERSRDFLDAVRKSKNKLPDCLVKPRVTMKTKGIAAYKGYFNTVEDARESDKVICLIPGRDGRVYELQRMEQGEFIAPKNNILDFQEIRAGFTPALPPIPLSLIGRVIDFFRALMEDGEKYEALALIYWDKLNRQYLTYIPKQVVTQDRIEADLRDCPYDDENRYIRYADIHSHNSMDAYFSPTDDLDEKGTGLYLVAGHLEKFFPDIEARIACGGSFVPIDAGKVIEDLGGYGSYPQDWLANVVRRPAARRKAGYDL